MKGRVPETDNGIQGTECVEIYDTFARTMRDKGYLPVKKYMSKGLRAGSTLELGPGPGYVGIEWLRACPGASLTGLEISLDMIHVAEANARVCGVSDRARYVEGNVMGMPFRAGSFDCVFSNGSLHEWEKPEIAFAEILRVLKPGGKFCVTDLRRDAPLPARLLGLASARPKAIRKGFMSSLNASYTRAELTTILQGARIQATVEESFMDLSATGEKTRSPA